MVVARGLGFGNGSEGYLGLSQNIDIIVKLFQLTVDVPIIANFNEKIGYFGLDKELDDQRGLHCQLDTKVAGNK